MTVRDLIETAFRLHAEAEEQANRGPSDDEARWQRYRATGEAVPFDKVRAHLQKLAEEAGAMAKRR